MRCQNKYIVTWVFKAHVSVPCPDYKPDPYTGQYPTIMCAVAHHKLVTENRTQSFDTLKEAEIFINRAPQSCSDFHVTHNGVELTIEMPPEPSTGSSSNICIS